MDQNVRPETHRQLDYAERRKYCGFSASSCQRRMINPVSVRRKVSMMEQRNGSADVVNDFTAVGRNGRGRPVKPWAAWPVVLFPGEKRKQKIFPRAFGRAAVT